MKLRHIALLSVIFVLTGCLVKDIPVSKVFLDCDQLTLTEGETHRLTHQISPSDATNLDVFWKTDNGSVATVSQDGTITAVSTGTANISVTSPDCDVAAVCKVTVTPRHINSTELRISSSSIELAVGQSDTLYCQVLPSDASYQSVIWSSSDASVAYVQDGIVKGVSDGTAVITASNGELAVQCNVTVLMPVASIALSSSALTLDEGAAAKLTATVLPENATDRSVTWTSLDETVATVSADGTVNALKAGKTEIMATSNASGQFAFCSVEVISRAVVALDKSSISLNESESIKLVATVTPDNATDKSVTWSSLDESVATVSQDGTVKALKAGKTDIIVTSNASGKYAYCSVEVLSQASVSLDKSSVSLYEGENVTLTATVTPDNATDKSVVWRSLDESVASVSPEGKVTAVTAGKATIIATSKATGRDAVCVVEVLCHVESVTLDKSEVTLQLGVGDTHADLVPVVGPERASDKSVTWRSNNPKVAAVDENGRVTAVGAGFATIQVKTVDSEKTASCVVQILAAPVPTTGLTMNPESLSLVEGESATIRATVLPEDATDKSVTWSSSDTKVATVTNDGRVTALKPGTSTICAVSADGSHAFCKVEVRSKLSSLELTVAKTTLYVGESTTMSSKVTPAGASEVVWEVSDAAKATIKANGYNCTLTAVSGGEVTVTVKTPDGDYKKSEVITILTHVSGVSFDFTSFELPKGQTRSLNAKVAPESASDKSVTWASDNTSVATVDQNGNVKAVSKGTANITVTTKDGGKKASCAVTVTQPVTGITLDITTKALDLGNKNTVKLKATVAPEDANIKDVLWSSSNSSVARVDQSGNVTAAGVGSATITATTADGGFKATCDISVVAKITPVTGVVLSASTVTLKPGQTHTLTAQVLPEDADDKGLTWKSTNPSAFSVDQNGLVTAINDGQGYVEVTTNDGAKTAKCKIEVTTIHVKSVSLNQTGRVTLAIGSTYALVATVSPDNADDPSVTWTSSNESVVTVSENGSVTAVGEGEATVTVRTKDGGLTASCPFKVLERLVYATNVTLSKSSLDLAVGEEFDLVATVAPSNATVNVEWSLSIGGVVSIDENGHLRAIKAGKAYVTAKALSDADGNYITKTCTVNVTTVHVTGLTLDQQSLTMRAGDKATLIATLAPANASNKNVQWRSSNSNVASVSGGVVTAKAEGDVTITATSLDGSFSASCKIHVKPDGAENGGSEPIQINGWN